MDIFETIKALERGKKVRKKDWEEDVYIIVDKYGNLVDEKGCSFGFTNLNDNDWEIVDERKEVKQLLKDLYKMLDTLLKDNWNHYDEFLDFLFFDGRDDANRMEELFEQLKEMNKYYNLDK